MITPKFQVSQDDENIFITIFIQHVRAKNIEFDVDGNEFRFFANPYYLRLKLTGQVIETEDSTAKLDVSDGKLLVKLSKLNKGEFFPDLDLLSLLLATKTETLSANSNKPFIIEEIDSDLTSPVIEDYNSDTDTDWELPQTIEEEILIKASYGFNSQYSGWFVHVDETPNEINCIASPESTSNDQRVSMQYESEDLAFNEDYYMSNYIEDEEIEQLISLPSKFQVDFDNLKKEIDPVDISTFYKNNHNNLSDETKNIFEFSNEEQELLLKLPRKSYIINNKKSVYLGILDILLAYAYNYRAYEGENTVESVWTIGILSSSCSCLRNFDSLTQTIVSFYRRESSLISLSEKMKKLPINKTDIGWPLDQYEDLALETSSESGDSDDDEPTIAQDTLSSSTSNVSNPKFLEPLTPEVVPEISKPFISLNIGSPKKTKPLIEEL
ncbi:Protein shq1 [Smittium mucronatum]|uniref:Protein shq1 n=1 Tax=Smittium mucronatum TaxID=133383 RepID=A0A1R0GS37_9FUNG|nr:Protein shq1 [Smittium mucronatum]